MPNSSAGVKPNSLSKETYFRNLNALKYCEIRQQAWAKENMRNFHYLILYSIVQCTVWKKRGPLMRNYLLIAMFASDVK